MNNVGKIFVGVIAILSVICVTLCFVAYKSHRDFKKESTELKAQWDNVEAEKSTLDRQKEKLEVDIDRELVNYQREIDSLRTKLDTLATDNKQLHEQNIKLHEDLQQRVEVITANNGQIDELRQQLDSTSYDLAEAQQLRANYLADLARTMEKLYELSAINGDLDEQNADLVESYKKAKDILAQNGLSEDPSEYAQLPQYALQGTIEKINADEDGLVLISIGSDDGLVEANQLDVRRGSAYIGKIEVVAVEPNRAVCRVLSEFREGVLMEGDDVYSQKVN